MQKFTTCVLASLICLFLAGCGGDDDEKTDMERLMETAQNSATNAAAANEAATRAATLSEGNGRVLGRIDNTTRQLKEEIERVETDLNRRLDDSERNVAAAFGGVLENQDFMKTQMKDIKDAASELASRPSAIVEAPNEPGYGDADMYSPVGRAEIELNKGSDGNTAINIKAATTPAEAWQLLKEQQKREERLQEEERRRQLEEDNIRLKEVKYRLQSRINQENSEAVRLENDLKDTQRRLQALERARTSRSSYRAVGNPVGGVFSAPRYVPSPHCGW